MNQYQQATRDEMLLLKRTRLVADPGMGATRVMAEVIAKLPSSEVVIIVTPRPLFQQWGNELTAAGVGQGRYFLRSPEGFRAEFDRLGYINTLVLDQLNGGPRTRTAAVSAANRAGRVIIREGQPPRPWPGLANFYTLVKMGV